MGLGPKSAIVGGGVYVFLGAKAPFVVAKRESDFFRFVRDCYVFGLMHVEVIKGLEEEWKKEIILI